jgi:hypothetical protein
MPDIGYYTLPVIPSFRGIESATQDQLDAAFRDSGRRAGQAYAEEHEKAFRQKKVDASRNPDSVTVEADRRRGTASGQAEADAHNEAFNKTRADDPAAVDTATKVGTEQGKASGQAAGKAHNEELKKTTTAESDSIGRVLGESLGQAAGSAAAGMIEDMLPKALRGLGLEGLGKSIGEDLGGAIGEHAADVPDALIKGWDTVADALNGVKSTATDVRTVLSTGFGEGLRTVLSDIRTADVGGGLTGALDGIKSAAGGIKDGLGGAVASLRNLSAGDVTAGLDRVAGMVQTAEPLAKAFGFDISTWPDNIRGVIGPVDDLSGAFTTTRDAIKGSSDALAEIAAGSPGIVAALEAISAAAGPIALALGAAAAGAYGLMKLRDWIATGGGDRPAGVTPDQARALWNGASPGEVANPNIPTVPGVLGAVGDTLPAGTPEPPHGGIPTLLPGTPTTPPVRGGPTGATTTITPGGLSDLLGGSEGGGPIHGPGPKGKDSVLMWGAPGEHVLTAPEVDRVGGHAAVYALRAALAGGVPGYQGGGAVGGNPPGLERYVDSMNGTPYSTGGRTDCSGMAARIANVYLGQTPQPSFTTQSEGSWLAQHGAIMGLGPPGTLRFGWYNRGSGIMDGHTAVTLPDGRNAESGGRHDSFLVGGGAAGADNPEFDHHAYFPPNPQGIATGGAGSPLGIGMGGGAAGAAGGTGGAFGSSGGAAGAAGVGGAGGAGGATATAAGGKAAAGGPMAAFNEAGGIGGIGDIGKQFLSDTFGFGSILPGLDDFPPTQFLFGLLGNLLGMGGGGSGLGGSLGNMLGTAVNPGGNALGMIPGIAGSMTSPTPGGDGPPAFDPALPGLSAGLGDARTPGGPQSVDQSMHVTVNGRSDDDMLAKLGRVMAHPPRAMTNAPQGG